ncbi:DUF3077 domain-containing protein [Pseudomonas sp. WS 5059]|jgi:hypothetical protein|uniref:DUF6124 family protein n=1 Tax=unclassified Pseudomonas TaxID=196821 RepID=UPI001473F3C6|nr:MULTISPECIES: DUF3077 domain-containing protein [unclassified Pseudomonas]NMX64520.1 DUF3077 domain-containing protein [Pseudomonas sp. WS 5079]NMX68415.1 DUF3077 domain-containing protein [Pseudomonas sp. WS 5111]NMX84745.1 DUF3077 domain-containing protein [Pseudomonas sp. WS 5010]NMY05471.1 DUF3077 domain-containing protein [Pseudomonas sp. WS 5059]NMY27778.1 DUF3077 domain-containing protein [Pseudomonas sp. WS 5021]
MTTTPDHLPGTPDDDEIKCLQGSDAARRALDYYFKEDAEPTSDDVAWFEASPTVSHEEALVHASDLLRSAAAIAYELANNKLGGTRDLAFSVVYLIDMAKAMLERPLQLVGGKTP